MTNSLLRAEVIIMGRDQGCRAGEQFERIRKHLPTMERARDVRRFFQAGWFRLWRKSLNEAGNLRFKKIDDRDGYAFSELQEIERKINLACGK